MICFDTQPLIWGVQGYAAPGQEGMICRTKKYIESLNAKRVRVIIPAPVLCEYLQGFTPQKQKEQRAIIERQFVVASFDLPAAELAAEILADREEMKRLIGQYELRRQMLRVDAFVIAVAIIQKVETIITHDVNHFPKLAGSRVRISNVPDLQVQGDLFPSPE
jgi:predicted nucleic acid-binding protein